MIEHLSKVEQIEFEAEYREWNDSLECQPDDYTPLNPDELRELQDSVKELLSR